MAGGTLASLLIKLGLDASGVETGAAKAKGAMGGIGISGRTLAAGGLAAAAAGFAVLSRGAQDLEAIQAKFQASTGASAGEAHDFAASVNAISGSSAGLGQTLESIAAAGTAVHTELGLSGQAADDATKQILAFSRATGQDAAEAVKGVDDILDGFNLTADKTPAVLDAITYASQHGAGSVSEIEANLSSLAPALNAANMTFDDGAALMLQFGEAGVSGSDAATAMTKALAKVKSPEELQRLMSDISNTLDPFERAQKAADLFGAKAGTKMAQVLQPGAKGLGDFKTDLDGSAGAAQTAADAMNNTFGSKMQLLLSGAGAAFRGFGQDLGPALTGVASVASLGGSIAQLLPSSLLKGIGPALMGLVPALGGVLSSVGTAMGGLIAAAVPIGIAALPFILIAALVAAIAVLILNPDIRNKVFEFVGGILKWIGDGLGKLAQVLGTVASNIVSFLGGLVTNIGTIVGQIVQWFLSIPGKLVSLGAQIVQNIINGLASLPGRLADAIRSAFANLRIDIGPFHISGSGVRIDLPNIQLPSFAVGSPFIPADMVARIHKGEMIVPAGPAAAFRDMLDALGRVSSFSGFGALGLAVAGGSPAGTHAAEPSRVADFVNSGDTIVLNIGTLYGGKQGLDELMRAIDDRRRQTNR